jgi:hypothetical protein
LLRGSRTTSLSAPPIASPVSLPPICIPVSAMMLPLKMSFALSAT